MENFIVSLETIFSEQELIMQINEDGDAIKSLARSEKGAIPVFGRALTPSSGFVILYYPVRITETQRPKVFELLARLYARTPFGNFMYDFESNLIGLQIYLHAEDEAVGFDNEEVETQLKFGMMELDVMIPAIQNVTSSQLSPEQAIEQIGEDDDMPEEKPDLTDPKNRLLDFLPGDPQNN
jgi:hypothetical protein|tara:strand:+ start:563 stop:1105 length:543 start_codon:yes stop_codon:yes gene_type:complete